MLVESLLCAVGLVILTVAADHLVRGSSRLAARLRVNPVVVGVVVIGLGTSAPEFLVSGSAAARTDKRWPLEVRPAGQQPVAVSNHAASVDEACSGALEKVAALLESKYGRSEHRKGGQSIRHLPVGEGLS